ncbi:MAG TPA: nuclear transport factor 2 family protein [Candidatus Acidoferrum sp.]|jgi:ketosteroid isomerase-like protein
MHKIAMLLLAALLIAPASLSQDEPKPNPEMQREEIVNLEKEAARAIQQSNGTFFRRVYTDDFIGTLSHGQPVTKATFIDTVQNGSAKYDSFNASDINVRIFQDIAVATALWSQRGTFYGVRIDNQMRVLHVYFNGPRGWHAVAGQITLLPPGGRQPL